MIKNAASGDASTMEAICAARIAASVMSEAEASADAARVGRIVREHFALVWRTLRRMGVPEGDADDAAQQVFMVVSQRISSILEGRERAFLVATALRIASRAHRSRSRRREVGDEILESFRDPLPNPEELLEQRRAREILDAILDQMKEEQRVVFALYEIEQLTMAEIADALQIPSGTVASRLRRAREHVARAIERLEGPPPERGQR